MSSNTQPYEDTYLRQQVIAVAELQRQNKLLIDVRKPDRGGLPLPNMYDLDLHHEHYPFSYSCPWGKFAPVRGLVLYEFTPNNGELPPGWDAFELSTPLQAVTAVVDRDRHIASIKTASQELTLQDVDVEDSGYTLLEHINANLAVHRVPLVVWRVEWLDGENNRLWGEYSPPTVRNHQTHANATGYAIDDDYHLIYLGMVGYKTSLESIRATLQASKRQRKFVTIGGHTASPFGHYVQTWTAMPDYNSHHAVLTTAAALPGRWSPGDALTYLLVFDGKTEGQSPVACLEAQLVGRLSEALTIPILKEWASELWVAGQDGDLITELTTGGDCLAGYQVALTEEPWAEIVQRLLNDGKITIR